MVPAFYLKYAILGFKMSSLVKSDPTILTGSKKGSWSQNLRCLSQKTKILTNNVLSKSFGKYSFDCQDLALSCLSMILLYVIELSIKLMKLGLDETPDTCRHVKILTLYERLVSYLGSLYKLRLHLEVGRWSKKC